MQKETPTCFTMSCEVFDTHTSIVATLVSKDDISLITGLDKVLKIWLEHFRYVFYTSLTVDIETIKNFP